MRYVKKLKRHIIILLFFIVGFNSYSESVFTYDIKKDIIISAISIGVYYGHNLINNRVRQSNYLNRNDVNIIDRRLMFPFNESFDNVRNYLSPILFILPVITPLAIGGLDIRKRQNFDIWLTYGIMYAQGLLLAKGTRRFLGRATVRDEPRHYFSNTIGGSRSFPSGTAAYAFMPATFLSVTFSAEFPESPWRIPVIVGSHTLASIVGASRILSGGHFLTDVLAGAALGSFYGWLIPTLHKRTHAENRISFNFVVNGLILSLKF